MKITTRLAAAAAATAALTALLVPLGAGAANAAVTGYSTTAEYIGGGNCINVRSGPSRDTSVVGQLQPGRPLSIECQTIGGQLGFSQYAGNRTWDKLGDGRYVHDVLTTTPAGREPPLPMAGASHGVRTSRSAAP